MRETGNTTADYAGNNSARQSIGLPGHCEDCASLGHVEAHPDLGCGDVGCTEHHPEPASDTLTTRRLSPESIMGAYVPGDEHSWWAEAHLLWTTQAERMRVIADSIEQHGVLDPVLLGDDGRVWDGHHRIIIAAGLGLKSIPVTLAEEMHHA